MNTPTDKAAAESSNVRLLYPLNVWGLSFGCAVGWGAFMMPGNLFLPHAGPVGSIIAIALGCLVMLVIGANFCKLAEKYRDNGGFFAYVREVMGHDHSFLAAWALIVTYLSIMWANATAVVVLVRFLFGDVLQWGFHYQIAGFDVYGGEILTTWALIIGFGFFSAYSGKAKRPINTVLALIMLFGVIILFCGVAAMSPQHASFYPAFDPDIGGTPFLQIFSILMVTPWMFFGFESVTHGGEEFRFPIKRMYPLIVGAIAASFLAYSLPIAISVLCIPPEFTGWNEYINSLGSLNGFDNLPVFHSVNTLLGSGGVTLLGATVLSAILTGIIGLYRCCSYLLQSMAKNDLLPEMFASQSADGTPRKAVFLIMLVSLPIPLLGRTAIVWLVDAITISGSIAYAYVSLCRYREAKASRDPEGKILGLLGFIISIMFFVCPIIPDLLLGSTLATESYLLLAVWSVLGLIYYWYVFKHDKAGRFGKSFSMCTVLLFLNFFSSALWLRQVIVTKIPLARMGGFAPVNDTLQQASTLQLVLIIMILLFMADIFTTMRRREHELGNSVIAEQRASRTRSSYLANMTHDIALIMNAIMSYVRLAKKSGDDYKSSVSGCQQSPWNSLWQSLTHTDTISHYFLHLIKDMEKVDSIKDGRLQLYTVPTDIRYNLQQVKDVFTTQMRDKNIDFMVYTAQLENPYVYCDKHRLQRVLLNLISLSYEFTPPGGSIAVTLGQKGFAYPLPAKSEDNRSFQLCADYELRIKDSGSGMPTDFTNETLIDSDWQELFRHEGPERSLAITKHLIGLFDGSIRFISEPGQGTEIIVNVTLKLAKQSMVPIHVEQEAANMI